MRSTAAAPRRPPVRVKFRPVLPFASFLAGAGLLLGARPLLAATQIAAVIGEVSVANGPAGAFARAQQGQELANQDRVRTGRASGAELLFQDGSRIQVGPFTNYVLEEAQPSMFSMRLAAGTMRAWVKKLSGRNFKVRTPTAVCSVRGTVFESGVDNNGRSSFSLKEGQLGIEDNNGNQILLNPGESIDVDVTGLGDVMKTADAEAQDKEEGQRAVKAEVGLNMSKDAVLAAAAEEMKLAEYQAGKAIIDIFGNRVRLEQYILRPQADQFKLVVLNEREDRFDFFFFLGTFDKTLPEDLSLALAGLSGSPLTAPPWIMTAYQTGRSNTVDTVEENSAGGHAVDVNNNGYTGDEVTKYFDATLGQTVNLTPGTPFYKTLFDTYSIKYNGATFLSWTGSNITHYGSGSGGTTYSYIQDNGALGSTAPSTKDESFLEGPDFPVIHDRVKIVYGSGAYWEQYDHYLVSDDGRPANFGSFAGLTFGSPEYKEELLKWNFQQVITNSQFGGRKIDLVVEPKTLIQSGIIK